MRYDPCGRAVDVIRAPYRTACRFNRNSDEAATIHWYVVPEQNGALGIPLPINVQYWRAEKHTKGGVGEVFDAPRVFDGWDRLRVTPTDHLCGSEDDFRNGGIRDTELPPFPRDVTGIPECCQEFGALVMGGTGDYSPAELVALGAGDLQQFVGGSIPGPIYGGSTIWAVMYGSYPAGFGLGDEVRLGVAGTPGFRFRLEAQFIAFPGFALTQLNLIQGVSVFVPPYTVTPLGGGNAWDVEIDIVAGSSFAVLPRLQLVAPVQPAGFTYYFLLKCTLIGPTPP